MRGKRFEKRSYDFLQLIELNAKISLSPIDDHYNKPQKSAMLVPCWFVADPDFSLIS